MRFESAALSAILGAEEVRAAAEPYVRLLIRVPEGYYYSRLREGLRPALAVLDPDGREVDTLSLSGRGPTEDAAAGVAHWLRGAVKAPAVERLRLRVEGAAEGRAGFLEAVRALNGVSGVREDGGEIEVQAAAGSATPSLLETLGAEAGVALRITEPYPVTLRARDGSGGPLSACLPAEVPGCWYVAGDRVFVTRLLLDPAVFAAAAPGHLASIEARGYRLHLPDGPLTALQVLTAPMSVSGVVAIRPDYARGRLLVVAPHEGFEWDAVVEALLEAGGSIRDD